MAAELVVVDGRNFGGVKVEDGALRRAGSGRFGSFGDAVVFADALFSNANGRGLEVLTLLSGVRKGTAMTLSTGDAVDTMLSALSPFS